MTAQHITENVESCAAIDQRVGIVPGWQTWPIQCSSGRGQMSRWPDGRGAVSWGGDSEWGDWEGRVLHLDSGITVDMEGQVCALCEWGARTPVWV